MTNLPELGVVPRLQRQYDHMARVFHRAPSGSNAETMALKELNRLAIALHEASK